MKTKYDKLVEARQSQLDKLENEIAQCNLRITQKKQDIEQLKLEIDNITIPQSGQISVIAAISSGKQVMVQNIKTEEQNIKNLKSVLSTLKGNHKKLFIELEKAKHLKNTELQKMIKELKRKEQLNLDEIATMLFSNKTKEKE